MLQADFASLTNQHLQPSGCPSLDAASLNVAPGVDDVFFPLEWPFFPATRDATPITVTC